MESNGVLIQNEVNDATQEMLVELQLVMFVSFGNSFKCNSTNISCVASVTTFSIMNPLGKEQIPLNKLRKVMFINFKTFTH